MQGRWTAPRWRREQRIWPRRPSEGGSIFVRDHAGSRASGRKPGRRGAPAARCRRAPPARGRGVPQAHAREPHRDPSRGRARRRPPPRARCVAAARWSTSSGAFSVHPTHGGRLVVEAIRRAEPDEYDPDLVLDGPIRPGRPDGGRPARADRDRPGPPPAPPAGDDPGRRRADVASVPRRSGGQALPPGLSPRPARAFADRRPGGERHLGHVPGHRPRCRGHRRAPARHRQARRLRAARRRHRDV